LSHSDNIRKVPDGQRALVLQGGGSLGAYEAGAYQAIYERFSKIDREKGDHNKPLLNIVAGTSIGAINAAIIVSYVTENNTWDGSAERLNEFWEYVSKESSFDLMPGVKAWCDNIRLRAYVILLAATGMRAVEALSIRIKDINFDSNPATLFVRGEFTKTKTDRTIFLTKEVTQQLKSWLDYKYRSRRVCHKDKQNGKLRTEYRTPNMMHTDLVFAVYQDSNKPNPDFLYDDFSKSFCRTLDRSGRGDKEDGNQRRRKITLHSFRRFVKTTISDLGYADFSEWFLGHSGSLDKKGLRKSRNISQD